MVFFLIAAAANKPSSPSPTRSLLDPTDTDTLPAVGGVGVVSVHTASEGEAQRLSQSPVPALSPCDRCTVHGLNRKSLIQ